MHIFKLLIGATAVLSSSQEDLYYCDILKYQRPSCEITELPVVRADCNFTPASDPNQNEFRLIILNNTNTQEASKKFISKLEFHDFHKKSPHYNELCEKFDGLSLALKWARHIYYLNRCVEKYPELQREKEQREKELRCRLTNVIEPKYIYPEDGVIYDFKCKYEEVERKKYHEEGLRLHLNSDDADVEQFECTNQDFQRRSLNPAMKEAEVNFLMIKCLENTLGGSGFRYR